MTASLWNGLNGPVGNQVDGYVYPQFLTALRNPTTQDIYPPGTRFMNSSTSTIYETTGN